MELRIFFFGVTADIAGTRMLHLPITAETTTADEMLKQILSKFPGLGSHKLYISINQQYATGDEIVQDGDELAIFTAVSGG